ncbi:MAG: hypothetical protein CMD65_00355 [Gammaproteobacteria bacterium]|nr:hypothetical protein [Gammaproteobacteria bacterium]
MIKYKIVNSFKCNLIFIILFLYSCEEDKSLVLNPQNNIDYDLEVFFLDSENSSTFRMSDPPFHSGLSSNLYVGNIINFIDEQGNTSNEKSYIYLKIKNELIKNNLFCSETIVDLNNVQLKLPTITDTEILYSPQFFDNANLSDCTLILEEDECNISSHCHWIEDIDSNTNEIISVCIYQTGQNPGDYEHNVDNSLNAYLLKDKEDPSQQIAINDCANYAEENSSVHSQNFIDDCNLSDAISLPIYVSSNYDYITIDLQGYLYSENIENSYSAVDCSILGYNDCLCNQWTFNQDTNQNECLLENHNNDCYWQGSSTASQASDGICLSEQFTDVVMNLDPWCNGESNENNDDIIIIIEYNPTSSNPSKQLLELYSSDESYLYNNPYLYLSYDVEEVILESFDKYSINSINSNYFDEFLCSGGSSCTNIDNSIDTWGTVLSFDLNIIENYLSLTDEDSSNDVENLTDCNLLDINNCTEYSYCILNENTQECQFSSSLPSLIPKDYEGEIFEYDIELNDENLDSFSDIIFHLNNIAFIYADEDPSNDNYDIDNNIEGTEANSNWDWSDSNGNQSLDILTEEHEAFDDYGLDSCEDEYERGATWDDNISECSDSSYSNKFDCLCVIDIIESPYNSEGTENNKILDWQDENEDSLWSDPSEGERWYDLGYDQVDDSFESGCFNEQNPYGGSIICWDENENENQQCSYETLLLDWLSLDSNNIIDNLDIYTVVINDNFEVSICGGSHWEVECETCSLIDPNGDNYNIDPSEDDYDAELEIGEEGNNQWDGVDNGDGICEINECEKFFDYGIDGLPDIYENYSEDIPDDNYSATNLSGTEGNGVWDFKDMNNNNEFDIEFDLYEPFFDYGLDQLVSFYEIGTNGEVYNSTGKQNNLSYNQYSTDIKEKFDDCGLDGDCEDGDISDDYNIDPNLDNFNYDIYPENKENDGQLDWTDLDGDGIWTSYEEGEKWYDYGYDHLQNNDENNYMANYANLGIGTNSYELNLENELIEFEKPSSNSSDQLILWISKIVRDENDNSKFTITVNVHSLVDIVAFQFQLIHDSGSVETANINDKTMLLFPYEFIDSDNNLFPSITEVVEDGEKYIIDASVYSLNSLPNESLVLNYAYGLKDSMNFITDEGVTLENFFSENNNSILSDEYTNLVLYFDNTKINHHLFDNVEIQLEYYDNSLDEYLIFNDIQLLNNIVTSSTDSLKIDIGPFIQKIIIGEISYNNFVLSVSDSNHNFSNVIIKDGDLKPRLEIFYSK